MINFGINEKKKIVIYGFSVKGKAVADHLKTQYNVVGFFDRNAKKIKDFKDKNIFSLEEGKRKFFSQKENVIIFISIANVFEHKNIADELFQLGFENIIFFPDYSFNPNIPAVKKMKMMFHCLLNGQIVPDEVVCKYNSLKQYSNSLVIEQTKDQVVFYLPIELIFTGDRKSFLSNSNQDVGSYNALKKLPFYFDIPVAGFSYYLDLFDFFEGNKNEGFNPYYIWKAAMTKKHKLTSDDKRRLLQDRYSVYSNLSSSLAVNNNFFTANPIDVKLSRNGYFFVEDGSNRCCFFISKGLRFIPAKIDTKSYERWKNEAALNEEEKSFLFDSSHLKEYQLVLNPLLLDIAKLQNDSGYQKYLKITRFIYSLNIILKDKKVLVINSLNSYFSLSFARMKAQVTSHVLDAKSKKLNRIINKLCFYEDIEVTCEDLSNVTQIDGFDVLVYLDREENIFEDIFKELEFIKESSAAVIFWEFPSENSSELLAVKLKKFELYELGFCNKVDGTSNKIYAIVKSKKRISRSELLR